MSTGRGDFKRALRTTSGAQCACRCYRRRHTGLVLVRENWKKKQDKTENKKKRGENRNTSSCGSLTAQSSDQFHSNQLRGAWSRGPCSRGSAGVWRSLQESAGVWRSLEESAGVWRSLEEFGRACRSLEESGGVCKSLEKSGGIWRSLQECCCRRLCCRFAVRPELDLLVCCCWPGPCGFLHSKL